MKSNKINKTLLLGELLFTLNEIPMVIEQRVLNFTFPFIVETIVFVTNQFLSSFSTSVALAEDPSGTSGLVEVENFLSKKWKNGSFRRNILLKKDYSSISFRSKEDIKLKKTNDILVCAKEIHKSIWNIL